MADETVLTTIARTTLETSGTAMTAGAAPTAATTHLTETNTSNFPLVEFVFTGVFAVAPTDGRVINIIARPMNIDGTTDSPAPTAAYPHKKIGEFVVKNSTTESYVSGPCVVFLGGVADEYEIYLENATDQNINSGWDLYAHPLTTEPAA